MRSCQASAELTPFLRRSKNDPLSRTDYSPDVEFRQPFQSWPIDSYSDPPRALEFPGSNVRWPMMPVSEGEV